MSWPDILIGAILLIAVLKGFKRGFVAELSGLVALVCALITPWFYNGAFDGWIVRTFHASPSSSHVIGMFITGLVTYGIIMLLAAVLNIVAKLPLLGIGNALAGAALGFVKGAVLVWLILYVALFFPLSRDIRSDLHHSTLVAYAVQPDGRIDDAILKTLPWFARPFARPIFERHRV